MPLSRKSWLASRKSWKSVHRWSDDAKNKAERTLNVTIAASKETMMNIMWNSSDLIGHRA
ncbi:hypothetical protein [Methylosarcina fibrata]